MAGATTGRESRMYGMLVVLALAGATIVTSEQAALPLPDVDILKKAGVGADAQSLLTFLEKRTLPETERPAILKLVRQLGSEVYAEREVASAELIRRGPAVGEILRATRNDHADLETLRRAERCLDTIRDQDVSPSVPAAALRVLAVRKPAGAVEAVLAFLPFAENDAAADEARALLVRMARARGKADPLLVAALLDRAAIRRAAAGQALARAGRADLLPAVRKLLADPDASVRFRVATALACAGERTAVVTLIDTLPDLPLPLAWQAEDFLLHLAATQVPPPVAIGSDAATRRKCRDGWQTWWKANAAKVDLARLETPPKLLGNTLVVLLDQGRVLDLGPQNQVRWEVANLSFPLDAQLVGEDRLLIAEYYGNRVTERDLKGNVLWERDVTGPLTAQRLPNGNTFVATDVTLFEFDKDGKEVVKIEMPGENKRVMKALKLPNGEIACLTTDARVARLDAAGKEIHSFAVSISMRLFGGRIDMLSSGRVLVPHNGEDKVVEYDSQGKVVWEVAVAKPVSALRLPNGNTLVTSMDGSIGAVEFDRAGNQVWHFSTNAPGNRVTRAIRR
jgi:PQQ-like domain